MSWYKKILLMILASLLLQSLAADVDVYFKTNGSSWERNEVVTVSVVVYNKGTETEQIQGLELDFNYNADKFKEVPVMHQDNFVGNLLVNEVDFSEAGKVHYLKSKTSGYYSTIAAGAEYTAFILRFKVTSASAEEGLSSFDFTPYYTNDVANTDAESLLRGTGFFISAFALGVYNPDDLPGSTLSGITIVADTTAPQLSVNPVSCSMNAGDVQTVTLTNVVTQWLLGDDLQYIKYTLDGSDPIVAGTTYAGPITIMPNIGEVTLKFAAADNDNNWTSVQTETYTVDTIAPTMDNLTIEPPLVKSGETITVSFTVGETLGALPVVQLLAGGTGVFTRDTSVAHPDYVYTYTLTGSEAEGSQNIRITIQDILGNQTTDASLVTKLDFTAPEYTPLAIGPNPVISGNPVIITFNASEKLSETTTVNIMGRASTRLNELDNGDGSWQYVYQSEPLDGTEKTAIIVVHGYDVAENRSHSNDDWGNIIVTGTDLLDNTGTGSGYLEFVYDEE